MKSILFIVLLFFVLCSSVFAQKRLLSKADFDSIRSELNTLPDTDPTKRFLAFFHDMVLIDGHREYVSMSGKTISSLKDEIKIYSDQLKEYKQEMNKLSGTINLTDGKIANVINYFSAKTDSLNESVVNIGYNVHYLSERVDDIESVLAEDETTISGLYGDEIEAQELALELIKERVAERRRQQQVAH